MKSDAARLSDSDLVFRARSGDTQAYGLLVTRYQGHVYGLAYSLVGNWAEAQDITQEAFIRAYMNLDQLRDGERFAAWLRRVAFGVTMNWLKAFRPGLFQKAGDLSDLEDLGIEDFQPGPDTQMEKREMADAVLKAITSLPPKYRIPLTMFHLDGLSYQKVADFLDIPLGTAKSLIHRAREKLKPTLSAHLAEEVMPVVQEVFDEHKLPNEFGGKVIRGVEALVRANQGANSVIRTLVVALKTAGEEVSYEFLMGVSGAAFRIQFAEPDWCPSSPHACCGFDCFATAVAAINYDVVAHSCNPDDAQSMAEIRRAIMKSINKGIPVLFGREEQGLLVGYQNGGKDLLGHSYWDWHKKDGLVPMNGWPWGFGVLVKKKTPPDRRVCVLRSLELAVTLARTPAFGNYASGFAAYQAWIADLNDSPKFGKQDEKGQRRVLQANAHIYMSLMDARAAAASYLHQIAADLPGAFNHLASAAERYGQVVSKLKEAQENAPWPRQLRAPSDWTEAMRHAQAAALTDALALETESVRDVAHALAKLGETTT